MSDYYPQFLSSMAGAGGRQNLTPHDASLPPQQTPPVPVEGHPIPNPYTSLGHFTGFPEPIAHNVPKASRHRRKSAAGLDQVKHRRSRSGCLTCRSRRVKCDEARPVCDRCRKSKRECVWPDPAARRSVSGQGAGQGTKDAETSTQTTSPASSNDEDEDEIERDGMLETIRDEDEGKLDRQIQQPGPTRPPPRRSSTASSLNLRRIATSQRQDSETPSAEGTKSSSPSVSTGTASSLTIASLPFNDALGTMVGSRPEWAHLSPDMQFYLSFFCENITHYHYCMVTDADDFFRSILPAVAIQNDALLFAVVGFAAYHYTMRHPNGKVNEFLQYYNRSVTLLIGFLKRKEPNTLATLMTILQLATIEEYLGDWVNIMGHQKAALEILTQLYTPQSVVEAPATRMMLTWYVRFDLFVAMMGRFVTALPLEYFSTYVEYCQAQSVAHPDNVDWKFDEHGGRMRLISAEMSILFGQAAKREITREEFDSKHRAFLETLYAWKDEWDPAMTDPAFLVTQSPADEPLDPNDIVNPFASDALFKPPLFAATILTCEWLSLVLMHETQISLPSGQEPAPQLARHSLAICQIFEAVELAPFSPRGSLITIQACLAIAALFLPRDERHQMWVRRKFALLESLGYIFPLTTRKRMAGLYGDQSCVRWWLPDDEGFSPILQSLRAFADERNDTAVSAQAESIRLVRHLLGAVENMTLASAEAPDQGDDEQAEQAANSRGKEKGKGKSVSN